MDRVRLHFWMRLIGRMTLAALALAPPGRAASRAPVYDALAAHSGVPVFVVYRAVVGSDPVAAGRLLAYSQRRGLAPVEKSFQKVASEAGTHVPMEQLERLRRIDRTKKGPGPEALYLGAAIYYHDALWSVLNPRYEAELKECPDLTPSCEAEFVRIKEAGEAIHALMQIAEARAEGRASPVDAERRIEDFIHRSLRTAKKEGRALSGLAD